MKMHSHLIEVSSKHFEMISTHAENTSRTAQKAPLLSKEGWPKAGVVVSSNFAVVHFSAL